MSQRMCRYKVCVLTFEMILGHMGMDGIIVDHVKHAAQVIRSEQVPKWIPELIETRQRQLAISNVE